MGKVKLSYEGRVFWVDLRPWNGAKKGDKPIKGAIGSTAYLDRFGLYVVKRARQAVNWLMGFLEALDARLTNVERKMVFKAFVVGASAMLVLWLLLAF